MNLRVSAAFVATSLIWGMSFLFIKVAGEDLTPFTLVAVRTGLGMTGLWTILLLSKVKIPRDRALIAKLAFVGVINTAIPFVLITWGERTIDSGVASVLNSTTPLFALVIAHFALADERITSKKLLGLLLGFFGVFLIFSRGIFGGATQNPLGGQLAVIIASAFYAFAAVYVRRNLRDVEPLLLAVFPISTAFIVVSISALIIEAPLSLQMSTLSLVSLLALGLLGTCAAHILFFFIMREWGATRATLVTYLLPVVGVSLGALILDEPIDWRLFVGFIMIVGGIALVNRRSRPHQHQEVETSPVEV